MASDRAPLLRSSPTHGNDGLERLSGAPSSPTDPAIGSSTGGDGTRGASYSGGRSGDCTQAEQRNAEDDELTDEDEQEDHDQEEARGRDPRHLFPRSAAAERSRRAPRVAVACRGNETTAFAVTAAAVCLLVAGASVEARARFRPEGEVEREEDTAASLGDERSLPQCCSTSTADPSIGA